MNSSAVEKEIKRLAEIGIPEDWLRQELNAAQEFSAGTWGDADTEEVIEWIDGSGQRYLDFMKENHPEEGLPESISEEQNTMKPKDIPGDRKDGIIADLINELSEGADEDYLNLALSTILSDDGIEAYCLNGPGNEIRSQIPDDRKDNIITNLVDELSEAADEDYLNLALSNIFTEEEMQAYGIKQPDIEEEEIFIPSGR